jgi:CRP/FNR family transcriptional regulator, anaerobic regulatory protein
MKANDIKPSLLDLARCNTCGVRKISLFAEMPDEDFSLIHQSIDDLEYSSGAMMFRQGEEGAHIFTIRKGMIKLCRIRENGDLRIMRVLRQGDVVGLEAIVANHYEYDAIALESVMACRIPVGVIKQLDGKSPRLHLNLLGKWHKTLVEADEWMAELTSGTARARLARLLLKMRSPVQPEISTLFSRDDIGSMLCMTMETASRTINAFQREGKISSLDAGGRIYRVDSGALEAEINNSD